MNMAFDPPFYGIGIIEHMRGLSWWRRIELRLYGWAPRWSPWDRPQPTSCWADIKDTLHAVMAAKNMPMTRDDYLTMISYHHLAYENILRGSASAESWGCLALASNIALILAEVGIGEGHIDLIQCGQDGLLRAKSRGEKAGNWRLDGMGALALGEVIQVLDAQLEIATRGEIVEARNIILQRMAEQEAAELLEAEKVDAA